MIDEPFEPLPAPSDQEGLHFLTAQQVVMIDEALDTLGDFGELRLVVEKGRLRFVVTHKSFDALKYSPGMIKGSSGQPERG